MKLKFTFLITALLLLGNLTTWGQTSVFCDFEEETCDGWVFTNISSKQDANVNPKNGSYFATTDAKTSSSVQYGTILDNPTSITCWYTKTTSNTNNSSQFLIQKSSNGIDWTTVASGLTMNNVTKGIWYELTADLTQYSNIYVRIFYSGTTAVRALDYITLVYTPAPTGYTVTYDANSGTGTLTDPNSPYASGDEVTVLANTFTKNCYSFANWNTAADGTGTSYVADNTFEITSNVTLYAQWTQNTYNIVYHANGGTGTDYTGTKTCGTDYTILDNNNSNFNFVAPTDSPNFVGWATATDGEVSYLAGDTYSTDEAIDLYAKWSSTTYYNVTFDCDGATSGCPETAIVEEGTSYTLPAAPTKEHYTFDGWYCTANELTYLAGANYTVNSDVEFWASWTEITYTVTFNPGTGTVNPTSLTGATVDLSTLTVTAPTGWTFYGWATASVEAAQTMPTIISGTTFTPTADTTLYAVYSKSEGSSTTDVLTASDLTATSTTYTDFSGVTKNTAVYAGNSAKSSNGGVIQLRSKDSESGIISTTADGKDVSKIIVDWHSSTTGGRTLDVYGSNTAYSGANANILYTNNQGTKLGSIECGTSTELIISGNYKYVGLRSYDGAMYITSISIIYGGATTTYNTNPSVQNITSNQNMPPTVTSSTDVFVSNSATVTVNSDIEVHNITIAEGSQIIINSGSILDVKGTFTNTTAAGLIIKDGGQLIFTSSAKSNVQGTVEKNFVNPTTWGQDNTGWHFISSPVASQTISSFINNAGEGYDYDLYKWVGSKQDVNNNYTPWYNYKDNTNEFGNSFIKGVGYLASYQSAPQFDFSGVLNTGTTYSFTITIPAHSESNEWENYVLLGNPYTYNMDWSKFTKNNVYDGLAIANPSTGAFSYSTSGSVAVGQGFMIYTTAENPALSYNMNSGAKRDSEINEINIIVESENCMDNAIIRIGEEVGGFKKLANMNKDMALIYLPVNGTDYAIASYTDDVNEIPLCFKTPTTGYYTISMKPQGEFNNIYLFDKIENVEIDMLNRGSYEFIGSPKDMENRFTITLNRVNTPNNTVINNFAFISNNELVINNIEGEGTIQIIDIVGRVASQYIVSGSTRISTNELSKGVYMVRLIDNAGSKTQKIVVK